MPKRSCEEQNDTVGGEVLRSTIPKPHTLGSTKSWGWAARSFFLLQRLPRFFFFFTLRLGQLLGAPTWMPSPTSASNRVFQRCPSRSRFVLHTSGSAHLWTTLFRAPLPPIARILNRITTLPIFSFNVVSFCSSPFRSALYWSTTSERLFQWRCDVMKRNMTFTFLMLPMTSWEGSWRLYHYFPLRSCKVEQEAEDKEQGGTAVHIYARKNCRKSGQLRLCERQGKLHPKLDYA